MLKFELRLQVKPHLPLDSDPKKSTYKSEVFYLEDSILIRGVGRPNLVGIHVVFLSPREARTPKPRI